MKININKETTPLELEAMHAIIFSFNPTQNIKFMDMEYQELMFDDVELETYNDMLEVYIDKISYFAVQQKIMVEIEEYELASMCRDIRNEYCRVYIHFGKLLFSDVKDHDEIFTNLNNKALTIIQDDKN